MSVRVTDAKGLLTTLSIYYYVHISDRIDEEKPSNNEGEYSHHYNGHTGREEYNMASFSEVHRSTFDHGDS